MNQTFSSPATKKLALKFILDNIEYRKKCQYLQEIILLGKIDEVWIRVLNTFLNTTPVRFSLQSCSRN